MRSKECRRCKETKSAEEFSKSSRNKDGLISYCKECDSKYGKDWYARNKESNKQRSLKWAKENKEKFKEYQKKWDEENKEVRRRYQAKWYQENKKKVSANQKTWWDKNPDKRKLYKHKYYGKLRDQLGEVSSDIIEKLRIEQDNLCYYCDKKLDSWHLEHMVPVSRGGLHDDSNLCLSCPSCNLRKQTKTAEKFIQQLEEEKIWQ